MAMMPPLLKHLCDICSSQSAVSVLGDLSSDDWIGIFALARRHRVVPSFSGGLSTLGFAVPDVINAQVLEDNKRNLFNAMRLSAELVKVAKTFDANEIQFLCFKGLALLQLTDQHIASRHCGDIDILLCNRKDIVIVDEVLVSLGFERKFDLSMDLIRNEGALKFFNLKDVVYIHKNLKYTLEIHFDVSSLNAFPVSSKELYENRSEVTIGSTAISVMSKVDHQLYLLAHGSVHVWFRLKWLLDIPIVSGNGEGYFSDELQQRARDLGVERMVNQGLWLAHTLLGMPVRDDLKKEYKGSTQLQQLVKFANNSIFSSITPLEYSVSDRVKYMAQKNILYLPRLRAEHSYKLSCIRSLIVTKKDLEFFPLPSSMFWLYYPLRPFLWVLWRIRRNDSL